MLLVHHRGGPSAACHHIVRHRLHCRLAGCFGKSFVLLMSRTAGTTFGSVEARLVGLMSPRGLWFLDGLFY